MVAFIPRAGLGDSMRRASDATSVAVGRLVNGSTEPFPRSPPVRTHVRTSSVRAHSYGTNTCSRHCGHRHLPSGRSERWTWPARSSCSRTTYSSTGRSTGTGTLSRSIRTGRRCARGASRAVPARPSPRRTSASPPPSTAGPLRKEGTRGPSAEREARHAVGGRARARRRARPAGATPALPARIAGGAAAVAGSPEGGRRPLVSRRARPLAIGEQRIAIRFGDQTLNRHEAGAASSSSRCGRARNSARAFVSLRRPTSRR